MLKKEIRDKIKLKIKLENLGNLPCLECADWDWMKFIQDNDDCCHKGVYGNIRPTCPNYEDWNEEIDLDIIAGILIDEIRKITGE